MLMHWKSRSLVALLLANALLWMPIGPAHAFVKVDGIFVADRACKALQSITKGTNPGEITLVPDMAYEVLGQNKPQPSHYQVRVKGVGTPRWVGVECGQLYTNSQSGPIADQPTSPPESGPDLSLSCAIPVSTDNLLAISWQPSFCETHQDKPECQSQDASDFDAEHFTLHGLWPQPRGKEYCCLPSDFPEAPWSSQPNFDDKLDDETLALLEDRRMPGVESFLHRHEWYKHGTCYNPQSDRPEEEYFEESLALLKQINNSSVQDLFASRIGRTVSLAQIQAAFDRDFGPKAGKKVNLICDREGRITELWINLAGDIQPDTPIRELLAKAENARSECQRGLIDPVGFSR